LLLLALAGAPETERASVVGTFSGFFDLSQGLGSLIVGAVASFAGYRGAFGAGAVAAAIGIAALRGRALQQRRSATLDDAGALAAEHPGP
jgi:hypothetical protein